MGFDFTTEYLRRWNSNETTELNLRTMRWRVPSLRVQIDAHKKYFDELAQNKDAAELIKMRKLLSKERSDMFNEVMSLSSSIEHLDELISMLLSRTAYNHGYENAENDYRPKKRKGGVKA